MAIRGAMRDRGKVLTAGSPSGKDPSVSYSAGSEIRCDAIQTGNNEVLESGEVAITDWEIRVPRGTTLDNADGFRITEYKGNAVTKNLRIVGEIRDTGSQKIFAAKADVNMDVS